LRGYIERLIIADNEKTEKRGDRGRGRFNTINFTCISQPFRVELPGAIGKR
jgi:hypothetical protein